MQMVFKIIIFVVLFIILFSLLTFYLSIRPFRIKTDAEPDSFGLEAKEVKFKTADGLKLSGWWIPNNRTDKAIIAMHGYPADKNNLLVTAKFLSRDFNVLLFDFRYFGKSQGHYTTAGFLEKKDLLAAIAYLENEKNITKVGLYGFSMGGAVALMTWHENIKAIVSDSSYARLSNIVDKMYSHFFILKYPLKFLTKVYGVLLLGIDLDKVNPVEDIKEKEAPILLIHGRKDSQIPFSESYELYDANKKSDLWIIDNAEHGMTHAINEYEYERRILKFFKENV